MRKAWFTLTRTVFVVDLFLIGYMVMYTAPAGGEFGQRLWSDASPFLAAAFATIHIGLAWKYRPAEESRSWKWLFIGFALWAAAELTWGVYDVASQGSPPDLTLADLPWLAGYFWVAGGLSLYLKRFRRRVGWPKIVLSILFGCLLAALAIRFATPIAAPPDLDQRIVEALTLVIYPVFDILLAAVGILPILVFERGLWWRLWLFIGAGLMLTAFADIWFAILNWHRAYALDWSSAITFDIPYAMSYLLVGIGCALAIRQARQVEG